jgi:hypothetical protein
MTNRSTRSDGREPGKIGRERTRTPLLVLAVALCLLMSSEALVGAELARSEHERVEIAKLRTVEGTVTKVDTAAGTLRVAWGPLGVLAKILEVDPETRIRVVGRPATLEDIRETATVRVGYQIAQGRSIAKSIEMVLAPTLSARVAP